MLATRSTGTVHEIFRQIAYQTVYYYCLPEEMKCHVKEPRNSTLHERIENVFVFNAV